MSRRHRSQEEDSIYVLPGVKSARLSLFCFSVESRLGLCNPHPPASDYYYWYLSQCEL